MLERHVEMTNRPEDMTKSIEGKKICWNYRKGRCRFGSKCTFAHDSDLRCLTQPHFRILLKLKLSYSWTKILNINKDCNIIIYS